MTNLLLTGLPRGGLTVASALLDTLPDCVSLNEPAWQKTKTTELTQPLPYCKWLIGDHVWQRQRLLNEVPVKDFRAKDGKPLLDGMHDPRALRNDTGEIGNAPFTRPGLSPDFMLCIKQHALFTALLDRLVQFDFFKIIVIIRHPLDVIQSWQKQEHTTLADGKLDIPAGWWAEADRIHTLDAPPLERMVQLYEAFMERYHTHQDRITIIKYEDIINRPATISELAGHSDIAPAAGLMEQRPRVFMRGETDRIYELISKNSTITKIYYSF